MTHSPELSENLAATPAVRAEEMSAWLADCMDLDVAELPPVTDDLVDHGLHSVAMMRFAQLCRRRGVAVTAAELAEEPTIEAWRRLLSITV